MKRALEIILYLGGVVALVIVALHVVVGPMSVPGGGPVNATHDSEERFYAVIFAGYGLALIHAARDVSARTGLIRFLMGVLFFGGMARLFAWAAAGPPHPFFVAMLAIELLLPPLVWWMAGRVAPVQSQAGGPQPR